MKSLRRRLEQLANGDFSDAAADPFGACRLPEEEMKLCNEQAALVRQLVDASHASRHHGAAVLPPSIALPLLS